MVSPRLLSSYQASGPPLYRMTTERGSRRGQALLLPVWPAFGCRAPGAEVRLVILTFFQAQVVDGEQTRDCGGFGIHELYRKAPSCSWMH